MGLCKCGQVHGCRCMGAGLPHGGFRNVHAKLHQDRPGGFGGVAETVWTKLFLVVFLDVFF